MKVATLVLVIVSAACGSAAIYLGSKLADTRAQVAQLEQARATDAARIRRLEEERRQVVRTPAGVAREVTASSAGPGASDEMPSFARPEEPTTAAPRSRPRRDAIDETPEGQTMRRLQSEVRLRRTHADMPAALGLNANQADQLFNLLADHQVTLRDEMRAQDEADDRRAIQDAARSQRDAAIEALLGPQKAAEFQSFEKSIPARMQVNRIGESMAAANLPLSDAQRDSMIAAVMAEREASPPPERAERSDPDDSSYQARLLDWQADFSRRVQARVEPLLTAEQAAQYRQAILVQNARRAEARARAERGRQPATR